MSKQILQQALDLLQRYGCKYQLSYTDGAIHDEVVGKLQEALTQTVQPDNEVNKRLTERCDRLFAEIVRLESELAQPLRVPAKFSDELTQLGVQPTDNLKETK